mmetsp:Transcript_25708/g.58474  ORF Transcript_25708/g.58474 Transcript_25708/m.58474 type:complete len:201 (+) Transcript_25708:1265-1867(+)
MTRGERSDSPDSSLNGLAPWRLRSLVSLALASPHHSNLHVVWACLSAIVKLLTRWMSFLPFLSDGFAPFFACVSFIRSRSSCRLSWTPTVTFSERISAPLEAMVDTSSLVVLEMWSVGNWLGMLPVGCVTHLWLTTSSDPWRAASSFFSMDVMKCLQSGSVCEGYRGSFFLMSFSSLNGKRLVRRPYMMTPRAQTSTFRP